MLSLINDMLDICQMDTGKLNLYIEPSSLTDIFDAVLTLVVNQSDQKNITINSHFCCDQQLVLLDRRRVMQILTNLLNNAIKFSSEDIVIEFDVQYDHKEK